MTQVTDLELLSPCLKRLNIERDAKTVADEIRPKNPKSKPC
jgi:hypothetical protein